MGAPGSLRDDLQMLASDRGIQSLAETRKVPQLYLALPFVRLLGFDYSNPLEVYPEHDATFDEHRPNKVDLAVMRDGEPVIAIECKCVGQTCAQLAVNFGAITMLCPPPSLRY